MSSVQISVLNYTDRSSHKMDLELLEITTARAGVYYHNYKDIRTGFLNLIEV